MAESCWTLTYPCGDDVDNGGSVLHFRTEEIAQEQAATYRLSDLGAPQPRRLNQPCITVACGCCGYIHDEDDAGQTHFADLAEITGYLPQYGWTQVGGAWTCETCTKGPCDVEAGHG